MEAALTSRGFTQPLSTKDSGPRTQMLADVCPGSETLLTASQMNPSSLNQQLHLYFHLHLSLPTCKGQDSLRNAVHPVFSWFLWCLSPPSLLWYWDAPLWPQPSLLALHFLCYFLYSSSLITMIPASGPPADSLQLSFTFAFTTASYSAGSSPGSTRILTFASLHPQLLPLSTWTIINTWYSPHTTSPPKPPASPSLRQNLHPTGCLTLQKNSKTSLKDPIGS